MKNNLKLSKSNIGTQSGKNHNTNLPRENICLQTKLLYLRGFQEKQQKNHFVRAKFLWQFTQVGWQRGREFKYLYRPHFVRRTNRAVKIPTLFVAKSLGSQARGLWLDGWRWYSLPNQSLKDRVDTLGWGGWVAADSWENMQRTTLLLVQTFCKIDQMSIAW